MKPPPDPPPPLPEPYPDGVRAWERKVDRQARWTIGWFVSAVVTGVVSLGLYAGSTRVDATMKKGMFLPPPECGWSATLLCDDVPGVECRWDRRWRCGYGVPWPNVVVRHPLTEEIIKERYP